MNIVRLISDCPWSPKQSQSAEKYLWFFDFEIFFAVLCDENTLRENHEKGGKVEKSMNGNWQASSKLKTTIEMNIDNDWMNKKKELRE